MPKKRDQFWPKKLKWVWVEPVDDEPGFYDAEFGSLHLTVVKQKDGRYGVAVDADDGATEAGEICDTLRAAKKAACLLGWGILWQGMARLKEWGKRGG